MTKGDEKDGNVDDEFEKIRRYLPLKDYIRLGPIYSSWSAVARKRHHSPRFGLPYLVIQDPNKSSTMFYNLSHGRVNHYRFTELYGRYCCGSSHGWLVTIDYNLEMRLFDPFSRSQIKLPSLPSPPSYEEELIIYEIATGTHKTEEQVRRDFTVYKVILSADPRTSSDYMVIASYKWFEKLAVWKPGASKWTIINSCRVYGNIIDMLWHKERLYLVTSRYYFLTFDMDEYQLIPIYQLSHHVDKELRYLVELEGELHIVLRDVEFPSIRTISFAVLKFNIAENKQLMMITQLKSIGDNALFLGGNHSMAIPSNEFIKCQGDSIYYTDDEFKSLHLHGFDDLGNFNIKDGTIQQFLPSEVCTPEEFEDFPPLWLEAHQW